MAKIFSSFASFFGPDPGLFRHLKQVNAPEKIEVFALFFLLFLPFFFGEVILETELTRSSRRRRTVIQENAGEALENLATGVDLDFYVRKSLFRLTDEFKATPIERFKARVEGRKIIGKTGLILDIFLFNPNGNFICLQPSDAPNQWIMKQLLRGLCVRDSREQQSLEKQLSKVFPQMFGQGKNLRTFVNRRGKLIKVFQGGGDGWVMWDMKSDGGVFLFCRSAPEVKTRFSEKAGKIRYFQNPLLGFGYGDPSEHRWKAEGGISESEAEKAWDEVSQAGTDNFERDGKWWVFRQTPAGLVFFAAVPIPGQNLPGDFWPLRGIILVLWLTMGSLLSSGKKMLGSLRHMTVGLFLLSALVPVAGMAVGSIVLLDGRYEYVVNEIMRKELETLKFLDERFEGFTGKFKDGIKKVLGDPRITHESPEISVALQPLLGGEIRGRFELRDGEGKILFNSHSEMGAINALLNPFSRMALRRWAPEKLDNRENDPGGVEKFLSQDDLGFSFMADRPRYLHPMNVCGSKSFLYWDHVSDIALRAAFMVFSVDKENLVSSYLRRELISRKSIGETQIRFFAFDLESDKWVSPPRADEGKFRSILTRAALFNKVISGRIFWKNGYYWFSALIGRNLGNQCLFALYPDNLVQGDLSSTRKSLGIGMIIAILLAVFLGKTISSRFLRPVNDLEMGVKALHKRNFSWQVPVSSQDELGRLAETFNLTVSEMEELNLAGTVQAGLVPKKFPASENFEMYGETKFAGDLGGDCLECRILPDGRIFFLIGDVSGHGVASALLMAFVKAIISLWARRTSPELPHLACSIEKLLKDFGDKKHFLALFAGLIDPSEQKLKFISCGHPLPFLKKASGKITSIGSPAYPLGVRRKVVPPPVREAAFEPGDLLFCYTDGLIESRDGQGRLFGYDGLEKWLERSLPGKTTDLIANLDSFHSGIYTLREDDLTTFAILRKIGNS